MKKIVYLLLCLFVFLTAHIAEAQNAAMADGLRQEGKIYVVVLIILIVLLGLVSYLFLLDRKLTKMEKHLDNRKN